jgi:phosphatidylglycerophosphate synthase
MANLLTAIRLLLVVPIGLLMAADAPRAGVYAAIVLLAAIATDLADGPTARRFGTASPFGGTFDHTTDFLFVVSGMLGGVVRGVVPALLPVLVVAAFAQYFVDSYWLHRHRALRGSRLGRYNGILYFVPLCGDTLVRVGLAGLGPAVTIVCWTLVVTTLVSMGQRLLQLRASMRRDPAPLGAGTGAQSRR